ncbi:MAG: glycosyltransferase [Actinophytocola sp.]|nr:glycosyltransferase [Actinophytocola sp.]
MNPTIACVVLTQAKRPDELKRAVESVLGQRGVDVDLIVVGNGARPDNLPDDVRIKELPENVGIPAGRNAGIDEVTGELLLFLDDDAYLADDNFLARAAGLFAADPNLGVVQPRVLDPEGERSPRRFVPRLRVGDDRSSSDVVVLWEGTCVARRVTLERSGAWPGEFFFMHEGIELAWRVIDAGYTVRYCGELETYHPAVAHERHPDVYYQGARNRVWLAKRNLPAVIAVLYLGNWLILDFARVRRLAAAKELLRGYYDGLRLPGGGRRPISWRAAWRMTRAGRPPLI